MVAPSAIRLRAATAALGAGGVVACPTEAVWGLSCDPYNPEAVERLLALKQRPVAKGLILVGAHIDNFVHLLRPLSEEQQASIAATWPGPHTWLVPHRQSLPSWIHGDHDSVALRVTAHPVMAALCTAWGGPLVSTSANPGGAQPARWRFQVRRYFGAGVAATMTGTVGAATRPSTITDVRSGVKIRT